MSNKKKTTAFDKLYASVKEELKNQHSLSVVKSAETLLDEFGLDRAIMFLRDAAHHREGWTPSEKTLADDLMLRICGWPIQTGGLGYSDLCPEEFKGLTSFCGDQYSPDWKWDKRAVCELTLDQKRDLFAWLKDNWRAA